MGLVIRLEDGMRRYEVSWAHAPHAVKLATKRGWSDGESFWDFIEEDEITERFEFRADQFHRAVMWAQQKLPYDLCGQVRIARQFCIKSHHRPDSWHDEAVWHINGPDEWPEENVPHCEFELTELCDDEWLA